MGKPTLLVAGNLAGEAGEAHPDAVPIDYIIRKLRREMPEFGGAPPARMADRVFIIRSETGSGKSTVLPAYVFRLLRAESSGAVARFRGAGVICTQPRILTAQTIARDQAADPNYPDLVMGVTIGYQTGPVNEKPASGLVYATAGSLLAQLRLLPDADIMAKYRFIIVDEAHERSLDIDALLMQLKAFLRRNMGNPRLPFLLLASATLPVAKYAAYFELPPANVVEVTGRAFGVTTHWPASGTNDYLREAARVATRIHEEHQDDRPDQADILIFMPGKMEIEEVRGYLEKANLGYLREGSAVRPFLLIAIYREVILAEGRDYKLIKEDPEKLAVPTLSGKFVRPIRRIIISTVVAETGITIETLKYVIDCGWSRVQMSFYPDRFRGIVTIPAPQSRITQRKGRAGRKAAGKFYPLYTQNVFRALPHEQLPDIIVEGVTPIFFDVARAAAEVGYRREPGKDGDAPKVFRVENIDMLDPPPVDALAAALEEAVEGGYLRPAENSSQGRGHALTRAGEAAARFDKVQMPQVRTLLAGYLWRVSLRDLALVVSLYGEIRVGIYRQGDPGASKRDEDAKYMLAAQRAALPPHLNGDPAAARDFLADDFVMTLLVFDCFAAAADRAEGDLDRLLDWCDEAGIDFDEAVKLAAMRDKVIDEIIAAGLNPFWGDEYSLQNATEETFVEVVARIKHCIYAGLWTGLVQRDAAGSYRTRGGSRVEYGSAAVERFVTNVVRLRGVRGDSRDKSPPFLYNLVPGLVSVLDGFLDVDAELQQPREA